MIKSVFFAIFLFIFAVFPASGGTVHEVIITDTGFQPEELRISSGDTVRWLNKGSTVHSASSWFFDSGPLSPGLSFEYTSDRWNIAMQVGRTGFDILYSDLKNRFEGTISIHNGFLEILPRDSKFLQEQEIRMVIIYPQITDTTHTDRYRLKLYINETLIYEGKFSDLPNDRVGKGFIGSFYDESATSHLSYKTFLLPSDTFQPGIHKITMEADFWGTVYEDSVTYTILPTTYNAGAIFP